MVFICLQVPVLDFGFDNEITKSDLIFILIFIIKTFNNTKNELIFFFILLN